MLDPALLTGLGDLELVARVVVDGTVSGLHRSPFHGYSAEFSQYRHYRPGDDLKYVDWKLFGRTDRFYTKQYRETTNLVAMLALDASASMSYRGASGISKLDYARLLIAGLAHLLNRQGDGVGLVVYDEAVRDYVPPRRGQLHLRRLLVALSKVQPRGATASVLPVQRAFDLLRRRGLVIIVSDLYDEDERIEAELRRALHVGHEAAVLHVLTREEIELPVRGNVELVDLESRERMVVGPATVEDYRAQFAGFLERWRSRCTRYGIDYVQVTTDTPPDAALRSYLLGRAARGVS